MFHDDRGQRFIIILVVFKPGIPLHCFQGRYMGGKGEKLVLSLKCLLIKMELSRKVFSFQTQTLLFLLS